jgi:hypothetical protein
MTERYRKRGRTVRFESGHLIRIAEAGEAIEESGRFECRPLGEVPDVAEPDGDAVAAVAREIESLASHPLSIERLLVSEGIAQHEFAGRRWEEMTRRLHLAFTAGNLRALIDHGDFDLAHARRVAEFLGRAGARRDAPARLRLAPNVAAALLPELVGIAPMIQTVGGIDGKGQPVQEVRVSMPPWPNWYRPSYRVRPIRAPLDIRADLASTAMVEELPEAIAILAPVTGLELDVLCVDGRNVYPTTLRVTRVEAMAAQLTWFPYSAGVLAGVIVVLTSP